MLEAECSRRFDPYWCIAGTITGPTDLYWLAAGLVGRGFAAVLFPATVAAQIPV
jgi:hypothetical protein